MADAKVRLKSGAIKKLLTSSEVRHALDEPAQQALARMRANCPTDSGTLQGSLEVWDETTDRAVKRIGSRTTGYAAKVEANTGFMARSL